MIQKNSPPQMSSKPMSEADFNAAGKSNGEMPDLGMSGSMENESGSVNQHSTMHTDAMNGPQASVMPAMSTMEDEGSDIAEMSSTDMMTNAMSSNASQGGMPDWKSHDTAFEQATGKNKATQMSSSQTDEDSPEEWDIVLTLRRKKY